MKLGASVPFVAGAAHATIKRWDVTVFKMPEEPEVRYIKRVVGMPNESVRIEGGDLWVRPVDSLDFPQRLRRTLDHQQAMQMTVYDDAHRAARSLTTRDGCAGGRHRRRVGSRAEPANSRWKSRLGIGQSCVITTWCRARKIGRPSVQSSRLPWRASGDSDHGLQLIQHGRASG